MGAWYHQLLVAFWKNSFRWQKYQKN